MRVMASRASSIFPSRKSSDGVMYFAHSEPASRRMKSAARLVLPICMKAHAPERNVKLAGTTSRKSARGRLSGRQIVATCSL